MQHQTPHNIIFDLCGVLIHENENGRFTFHEEGFELLKKCHAQRDEQGNRLHQFFILSNLSSRYMNLRIQLPELFNYFDDVFVPSTSPYKKPDPQSYTQILNKHALDAATCIMIDDTQQNVTAARELGMQGIFFDAAENVEKKLLELAILSK